MRAQSRGAGLLAPTQGALPPFDLLRPADLTEARAMLAAHPDATIAAGCTDLVAAFREGLTPSALVSLRNLTELRTVRHADGVLRIGALNTHDDGAAHPVLLAALPEFGAAWSGIATVRIRFRATIGGNLMARRFRYEMPVVLGALDAVMELSTAAGERRCTVDEFVRRDPAAPGGRALLHHLAVDTGSLLVFRYDRSLRPTTTVALAVRRTTTGLRLTASVGSEYRAAVLLRIEADVADLRAVDPAGAAHELATQLPDEVGDYAGSAAYRRRVVEVLLRRQLEAAADRGSAG
jgi:carbon-monoxide dehydrogenase medium subunit